MKTINIGDRKLYDIEEEEINEFIEKYTDLQEYLFPYSEQDIDELEYNGNIILSSKYSVHFCSLRNCIIFDIHIPPSGYMEADETEGILSFEKFETCFYDSWGIRLEILNWFIKKGFAMPLDSWVK